MLLCLLALLLCCSTSASQAFALDSFIALDTSGIAYQFDLQPELLSWPDLDELSLQALQKLAEESRLHLSLAEGQHSQARMMWGQQEVFALESRLEGAQQQLSMEVPGSLKATSYVSSAQSPFSLLLGQDLRLPSLQAAKQTLAALAKLTLPQFEALEQTVKAPLAIRQVGQGTSQLVYTLKQEEALAFWQQAGDSVQSLLGQLYTDLRLPQDSRFIGGLDAVKPVGILNIKRILDLDGLDIGLQINGRFDVNGQIRRLAFLGGWSTTGFYLSIKLPALQGSNNLDCQISLARSPEALSGDWRLKAVFGKDSLEASGKLLLQVAQKGERQTLTGGLEGKLSYRGAQTSKQTFSIKPHLALENEQLSGNLRLIKQVEGQPAMDVILLVSGQPAAGLTALKPLSTIDLDTLSPAQLALEQARLGQALVAPLHTWMQSLPEKTQLLLLHDLGRDRRARDGRTVEALPAQPHPFTVESQPQNSPTKEDAP